MANDIYRAARDLNYRIAYEAEQQRKAADEAARRLQRQLAEEDRRRAQRRAEEQRREQQRQAEAARARQANQQSGEQSKVICTELHRQGRLGREDYLLGLRYMREHLTLRHERGYHAWAVPTVRRMRRSRRASAFWSKLAAARADHIAFVYGDGSRRNRFGALLCAAFAAGCWTIGGFMGKQDWRSLYRDGDRQEIPSI